MQNYQEIQLFEVANNKQRTTTTKACDYLVLEHDQN